MPLPSRTNILLLGKTGIGKSTFINGLANYFRYNSLRDAAQHGPQILIGGTMTHTDYDDVEHTIVYHKNIGGPEEHSPESNRGSTQEPKAYEFNFADENKSVTIIDTPGVGDVRGPGQDKLNFEMTVEFLSQYTVLHAICILVRADTACHGPEFMYSINEMLRHLSTTAVGNIMFCFTYSAVKNFELSSGYENLRNYLGSLKDIQVFLDRSNAFCFDSQSFRYLCALEHYEEEDVVDFEESWQQSVDSTKRLLMRISELKPFTTFDLCSVHYMISCITNALEPLRKISERIAREARAIREEEKQIEQLRIEQVTLSEKILVEKAVFEKEPTKSPILVCTSETCRLRKKIGSNHDEIMYEAVCLEKCVIRGVKEDTTADTKIQRCDAFKSDIDQCTKCGCSWELHMIVRYRMKERRIQVVDEQCKREIAKSRRNVICHEIVRDVTDAQIDEHLMERATIEHITVFLSSLLNKRSILSNSDSYKNYLNYYVGDTPGKVNEKLAEEIEKLKIENKSMVAILTSEAAAATFDEEAMEIINAALTALSQRDAINPDEPYTSNLPFRRHVVLNVPKLDWVRDIIN